MLVRIQQRHPDRRLATGTLAAEAQEDAAKRDGGKCRPVDQHQAEREGGGPAAGAADVEREAEAAEGRGREEERVGGGGWAWHVWRRAYERNGNKGYLGCTDSARIKAIPGTFRRHYADANRNPAVDASD